jgi:hypothetical protein
MASSPPTLGTVMNRPADEFVNDPTIEGLWAIKAVDHMQIYFNLISSIPPKLLKLTPKDDLIYEEFRKQFPDLGVQKVDTNCLKTDEAKAKWRPFCNHFEGQVEDFNYATMLRLDCGQDYSEENSIVVPRVQFLAIEIARNREGFNDAIREKFGKKKPLEEEPIQEKSDQIEAPSS